VVTVAENQRAIAAELHARGLVHWLGDDRDIDEAAISDALAAIVDRDLDGEWSRQCLVEVDGKGAARVCAALTATTATPLRMRPARLDDEARLLEWANDPITRRNAFSPSPIPAQTHRDWLHRRLQDPERCRVYVAETGEGIPMAQVRFEQWGNAWEVHYSLAPGFRGRGIGRPVLEAALTTARAELGGITVFGRVKRGNRASQRIFESLDFEIQPDPAAEIAVYRRVL
jgi:RimJ/RimL family protein N-acetyltransferase